MTRNPGRVRRVTPTLAVLAVLALAGQAGAGTEALGSDVWFLRDGRPAAVHRTAPGVPGLVRALLAGPTRRERSTGLRSAIPTGTALRDLRIERRVVTVDLAARFVAGRDDASLSARVGQLVRTLRAVPGVVGVRVRIEGEVPVGIFPGYDLRGTVREPLPEERAPDLRDVQQLLADLGFMASTGVTGTTGDETSIAVLAFQKWSGLPRTGVLDEQVTAVLLHSTRPQPVLSRPGKRVGAPPRAPGGTRDRRQPRRTGLPHTRPARTGGRRAGRFTSTARSACPWSVPFSTWMPFASYFVGGIAFHAYPSVPAYPASHGCVRMMARDAPLMYAFATYGTPVDVIRETIA